MVQVHSQAGLLDDGRMVAPAAERNTPAIIKALAPLVPAHGRVLEIAAGTGQHAAALARAFPWLDWQPTDIAPERLASIDAWRAAAGVENMRIAYWLDAATDNWIVQPVEMVYLANLFHLLPEQAAVNVIRGVARVLVPRGIFLAYGPFRVEGRFRSGGDEAFHGRLVEADPAIGYKDMEWIEEIGAQAGLTRHRLVDMPANNLIIALRKS